MQVLIVGAGIGGLTLALCLLRQGLKVTIYERSHTLEEVGAGIQIGPNGAKVFAALGLLHELEQVAFKPQAAEMRMGDTTGRVIFSLPLGVQCEQRYHAPYFNIHRADLQRILVNAVQHQAPNVIQLGYELKDLVQDEHGVEAFFYQWRHQPKVTYSLGQTVYALRYVNYYLILKMASLQVWPHGV
jgi:salicylate hydroxylase